MEDLVSTLITLVVVWSIIQGVLGKKPRQGRMPPAPGRRTGAPGAPAPEGRPDEAGRANAPARTGPAAGPATRHGSEPEPEEITAADLIPDDLWEILTGQRRSRAPVPPPRPESEPEPVAELEPAGPEAAGAPWEFDEDTVDEVAEEVPVGAVDEPDSEPGYGGFGIMGLEEPPPPVEARPAALRDRQDPIAVMRPPVRRRPPALGRRGDLRRAMVLKEILGPPKALE